MTAALQPAPNVHFMLDTNIVIYLIKHNPPGVAERVDALGSHARLCMSFITWAELLKGAERRTKKAAVLRKLDALAVQIPVQFEVPPSLCAHYARQATALQAAGAPIGANDLWIACHALACDATLVTNNLREFKRIKGLRLDNWAE